MLEEWLRKKDEPGGNSWFSGKKNRYILLILICLGLLALVWPGSKVEEAPPLSTNGEYQGEGTKNIKAQMTSELEAILSEIAGAGKVEVSLNLSSGGHKSYAINRRDERRETEDNQERNITKHSLEENRVEDLAVSSGKPVLVEELSPEVLGVLVVADGGGNAEVKERLTGATATLLNISAHRVRVMPRIGGD